MPSRRALEKVSDLVVAFKIAGQWTMTGHVPRDSRVKRGKHCGNVAARKVFVSFTNNRRIGFTHHSPPCTRDGPPHHVEAALPSSRIIADHRERVGRHHVPTRRDVRCCPIRRDREDELDLADIGGETGTATHGASIASAGREPKRLTAARRHAHSRLIPLTTKSTRPARASPGSPSASASQG